MGIGVSIFLIAVGAILTFAVHADISGFDINTIGIILMAVGALGLLLTLFLWGPRRTTTTTYRDEFVDDRPPAPREHGTTVRRY